MPDVINTWDNVQNTSCWVHDSGTWDADGVVERSATDIVALASAASGYADSAQAAAQDAAATAGGISGYVDAASAYAEDAGGYAGTASSYAASAGGYVATVSGYADTAGGYATAASGYAASAAGSIAAASAYAASAGGYAVTASGYADTASEQAASAGGYIASASAFADAASGYADTAGNYEASAGGYVAAASGYADTASGYAASAGSAMSGYVSLGGTQTISGAKTFTAVISGTATSATSAGHATSAGTIDGTLPISKGGTGADNISSARKALYGDSLTTSADYFLGITSNYVKGGYISIANAKTTLGITAAGISSTLGTSAVASAGHATSAGTATNAASLDGVAASGYVTVSSTQTISGAKTFLSALQLKTTAVTRGSAPASNQQHVRIEEMDSGGNRLWGIYREFYTTGENRVSLLAYNGKNTSTGAYTRLGIGYDSAGNVYTVAPTPAAGDNSTKIATTAFLATEAAGYVKTTADQTISGNKTFAQTVTISGDADVVLTGSGNLIRQNTSAGATIVTGGNGQSYTTGARLNLYGAGHTSAGVFVLNTGKTNNSLIGSGTSLTWRGNPVQTSSDERLKQNVIQVPAAVLDAWHKVNWTQFKYVDAVNEKGAQNARWHTGLVAQHVSSAMAEAGQDACAYGILCHDEWQDEYVTVKNDDGTASRFLEKPAGDQWTVRYTEALAMEAAYQRRRAARAEARIAGLEERLAALEAFILEQSGDGD